VDEVMAALREVADGTRLPGMARVGIRTEHALGVSLPDQRKLARRVGRNHRLALALWRTRVHEARMLASMIDDPASVTEAQMARWVRDFDSWDICDQVCDNLFARTSFAHDRAFAWPEREQEFVRRAGFALMAAMAVVRKDLPDRDFVAFLPVIEAHAGDDRNYVRKAVNWALRNIGKRSVGLNRRAIASAKRIRAQGTRSASWIAADALRELQGDAVQARLRG
jgi:3-methyladenine DNA glycosylase AlkD